MLWQMVCLVEQISMTTVFALDASKTEGISWSVMSAGVARITILDIAIALSINKVS